MTVIDLIAKSAVPPCKMQCGSNKLVQWSEENKPNMIIRKAKQVIKCQTLNRHLAPVAIQGEEVDQIVKCKLWRVIVILSVQRKANSIISFVQRLKRAGLQTDDLV